MVVEVTPYREESADVEYLTARVFFKSIELLGGLKKLAEYRNLTWLPALSRASFVVVLKEDFFKTEEEVAKIVGLTKNTVRNILRADPKVALKKIKEYEGLSSKMKEEQRVSIAGGIAKLAHKEIKEGKEVKLLLRFARNMMEETTQLLDIPWAYNVLKHTKGVTYPIESKEDLLEHLKGLTIKEFQAEEIIEKLTFPINNPAELLHEIKEVISRK